MAFLPVPGRNGSTRNQGLGRPSGLSIARWRLPTHDGSPLTEFVEIVIAKMVEFTNDKKVHGHEYLKICLLRGTMLQANRGPALLQRKPQTIKAKSTSGCDYKQQTANQRAQYHCCDHRHLEIKI